MATKIETIQYICEQIEHCGEVFYRKMMGEYLAYLNGKLIFLICDNTLYVKINDTTTRILGENNYKAYPYDGAKIHYVVEDIENKELMQELATEIAKITPLPKPKKNKV